MATGTHVTHSSEETHQLGKLFGQTLSANAVVAMYGDLGAGKTTFIRGLVEGAGGTDPREVCSPTFTLLNIYAGKRAVYHFDLYRLPRKEEFYAAGFHEHLSQGGICCIEWADKISSELPPTAYAVTLSYLGAEMRQIDIVQGDKI